MMWCSITRRGHIKSQYLQIVLIMVHVLPLHTDMQRCVLVVENKGEPMRTRRGATGKSNL